MECEFEFSISASCPGLTGMMQVPCVGTWHSWTNTKLFYGGLEPPWKFYHPSLAKRFNRILTCPTFQRVELHCLEAFKSNVCYYFAEVRVYWQQIKFTFPAGYRQRYDLPYTCFFLGKYPVYWDPRTRGPKYAHSFEAGKMWAIGTKPFVVGVNMPWMEALERDRWEHYFSPEQIQTYDDQARFLKERKDWQTECMAKHYTREPKPQRTTPEKVPWPARPITEIDLPVPDVPLPTQKEVASLPRRWAIFHFASTEDRMKCLLIITDTAPADLWGPEG